MSPVSHPSGRHCTATGTDIWMVFAEHACGITSEHARHTQRASARSLPRWRRSMKWGATCALPTSKAVASAASFSTRPPQRSNARNEHYFSGRQYRSAYASGMRVALPSDTRRRSDMHVWHHSCALRLHIRAVEPAYKTSRHHTHAATRSCLIPRSLSQSSANSWPKIRLAIPMSMPATACRARSIGGNIYGSIYLSICVLVLRIWYFLNSIKHERRHNYTFCAAEVVTILLVHCYTGK